MFDQTKVKPECAEELLGDVRAFAEQLGGAEGLSAMRLSVFSPKRPTWGMAGLRKFLRRYCADMLVGCELPAIYRAHTHASRYEVRELIAWDCQLTQETLFQPFAAASQRVGTAQLRKLRPLRDQRLVQRYLDAVEHGSAQGSHLVVYGLILWLYSLPLRQGLIGYAQQTLRGFLFAASLPVKLSATEREKLFEELCHSLPGAVDGLIRNGHGKTSA